MLHIPRPKVICILVPEKIFGKSKYNDFQASTIFRISPFKCNLGFKFDKVIKKIKVDLASSFEQTWLGLVCFDF